MPLLIEKEWSDSQRNALSRSFQNLDVLSTSYVANEISKIGSLINGNMIEQMRQIGETLSDSFSKTYLPMFSNIASQTDMARQLIDSIKLPELPEISEIYSRPSYPLIDLDLYSDPDEVEEIQAPEFDMIVQDDGFFSYKDRILRNINLGSKHGKFLKGLLNNDDHFVQDTNFIAEVDIFDTAKGIGYVVNDLKKFLKLDGIGIKLHRVRRYGYKLLDFEEIDSFPVYSLKS